MLWQKCHEMLRKRTAYFPTLTEASDGERHPNRGVPTHSRPPVSPNRSLRDEVRIQKILDYHMNLTQQCNPHC